jgi:hypothetical protein
MDDKYELWSFNNALFFVILIIIVTLIFFYGVTTIFDIKRIKNNWASERCNPTIMPFASVFGYNTKENFEFCMGKIFTTHSTPYLGSIGTSLSQFTGLLQTMFDSISSLRNIMASLGGGINVVFQEFTERISNFFFKLRLSAIHIKALMGRMYAILFSVMYMGLSGITGMTSFTNTFLFGFLDTFCFPGNTELIIKDKGTVAIKDIKIGDILLPTNSKVTATFKFFSKGQPMVKIGSIIVSTNHYILYLGHPIKAGEHPDAINIGLWNSDEPLYCLNTSDNHIPINELIFLDYDETTDADKQTMRYIENRINSDTTPILDIEDIEYPFKEYCPAIHEDTKIKTNDGFIKASDIKIGTKLNTGSTIIGLIRREANEICELSNGNIITPSTLYWNSNTNKWQRLGSSNKYAKMIKNNNCELVSFIAVPNSQIELEGDIRIRDYMELCSPDSEMYYSKHLENNKME